MARLAALDGGDREAAEATHAAERVWTSGARRAQSSTNAIGQGREPDAPAALGEASPDRVYGMVGQLAGCGWSIRIPVFGVPAGR